MMMMVIQDNDDKNDDDDDDDDNNCGLDLTRVVGTPRWDWSEGPAKRETACQGASNMPNHTFNTREKNA